MYPAKFPGLGEALIFFCFFSSIKGRKDDPEGKKKYSFFDVDHSPPRGAVQGAYAIRPYSRVSAPKNTSDIHCCESLTLFPYPNSVEMSDSPQ